MLCTMNERIKQLRIAHGYSQVEFAKIVGVTKQCVSNWENDNVIPSVEMLVKISEVFHVSTDYVIGRSEKTTLDVSDLTAEQISHLSLIVNDLKNANTK